MSDKWSELSAFETKVRGSKCLVFFTDLRNVAMSAPEELFDLSKPTTLSILHYSIVVEP